MSEWRGEGRGEGEGEREKTGVGILGEVGNEIHPLINEWINGSTEIKTPKTTNEG